MNDNEGSLIMRNEIKNLLLLSLNRFRCFNIVAIEKKKDNNRLKTIYELDNIIINNNNENGDGLKFDWKSKKPNID